MCLASEVWEERVGEVLGLGLWSGCREYGEYMVLLE